MTNIFWIILASLAVLFYPLFYSILQKKKEGLIVLKFLSYLLFASIAFHAAEESFDHFRYFGLFLILFLSLVFWKLEEIFLHSKALSFFGLIFIFIHSCFDGLVLINSINFNILIGMILHRALFEGALWSRLYVKYGKKTAIFASFINLIGLFFGAYCFSFFFKTNNLVDQVIELVIAALMIHFLIDGIYHFFKDLKKKRR